MDTETTEMPGAALGHREMPEHVRRGLINVQGGLAYLKASHRILWMRHEHPDWGIMTSIEFADYQMGFVVMRCVVTDGAGRIVATAHAEESRGKLPYLRKAETAAIARALGLCGYGTQFGEMDEDEDEARARPQSPARASGGGGAAAPAAAVWEGPGQCPGCKAPEGKKHANGCRG